MAQSRRPWGGEAEKVSFSGEGEREITPTGVPGSSAPLPTPRQENRPGCWQLQELLLTPGSPQEASALGMAGGPEPARGASVEATPALRFCPVLGRKRGTVASGCPLPGCTPGGLAVRVESPLWPHVPRSRGGPAGLLASLAPCRSLDPLPIVVAVGRIREAPSRGGACFLREAASYLQLCSMLDAATGLSAFPTSLRL